VGWWGLPIVGGMVRFDKKYSTVLFVTIMVFIMSMVISLALTVARGGFASGFFGIWLRGWALGGIVAWPTAMLVVPATRRIVGKITR